LEIGPLKRKLGLNEVIQGELYFDVTDVFIRED
jgi:hypothetical protein